jgi:septal ring factor EnvC (AmiA/AmiB activator)
MYMEVKEAVRAGLQEWILPVLNSIRDDNAQIKTILELTNKRLDDINTHFADQNTRIDETNNRIDETNKRLDETNKRIYDTNLRIDGLRTEMMHRFDN